MSNNVRVLLVGCGGMGIEHAKVLRDLKADIVAVGNSEEGTDKFLDKTGVKAIPGGIERYIKNTENVPRYAIVATPLTTLFSVTKSLIEAGVTNILVEKPAGLNTIEILDMNEIACKQGAQVFVAYNRRFFASSIAASDIIKDDGGLLSVIFEFTEWSDTIRKTSHPDNVKQNWLLANSTHVIDLAFFFAGTPTEMSSYVAGELEWHRNGAVYSGSGKTDKGCLFSYQANWMAPGRWGLELLTGKHRLYLRPMEKLSIQQLNNVAIDSVDIDDELDQKYKPGLYEQTRAFLYNQDNERLCSIEEHLTHMKVYEKIAGV